MGMLQNVLVLFPLAYRMYKTGSTAMIYFQGCYNIRVKNFVADIACQGGNCIQKCAKRHFCGIFKPPLFFYYSICQSSDC